MLKGIINYFKRVPTFEQEVERIRKKYDYSEEQASSIIDQYEYMCLNFEVGMSIDEVIDSLSEGFNDFIKQTES